MECVTQKLNFVVYAFWITSTGVVMSDRSTASPARNEVFTVSCFFFFNELVVEGIFYLSFLLLENTDRIHNRASASLFATDSGILANKSVAEGRCSSAVIYRSVPLSFSTSCTIAFNSREYPSTVWTYS